MQAHVRDARGLAFSSDGKWLVTSGGGSAVRIWDATTGKDLQAFHGHDGTAYSVAVSRDGKRIASGANDQLVKLWDVNSGQEIRTMRFGEQVRSVAFSPHGRQIAAAGNEGAVRIWDASDAGPASGQREALGMVIGMIETGLSKGEVDAQIKTDETISEAVRDTACRILKAYPLDEFAARNGERLARGGDWEKAAVQFTRACEAAPDDFHHWYSAALCELRFGRQDQYERTCRTMYERFKDDRRVVCNCRLLGICLLSPDAGVPLTKLEPLASRIQQAYMEFAKHGPARERSTYDLALFAYRRGNMAEAEVLLKEDLGAEINPSWYYLLAQVMIGQRQRSAAIEFFDQGRDLEASMAGGWIGPAVRHILCEQAHRAIEATANVR
jgi:hypothetical protein